METAIVLPVLLSLLLGIVGVGYLMFSLLRAQNGVTVLAELAAIDSNWRNRVQDENRRSGCNANPTQPDAAYPDGQKPGGRVVVTWYCRLSTGWLFDGLPLTVQAAAVIPGTAPTPSPSPEPS